MNGLAGKVAIITGGGSGIGRGIAVALAQLGVQVVICGRRANKVNEVASAIIQAGGKALAVQADVSQVDQAEKLLQTTLNEFSTVDILVNNAGIDIDGEIHDHAVDGWDEVMAVNLRGPFLMARAVLPVMRRQRRGHIIQISSEAGLEYYTGTGAYTVSKHALNTLSELIQRENQDYNIRVNTICPGMVWTEMSEDSPSLDRSKCLEPEDIADLVVWLLTRRENIKIGTPILIQTMLNPWE